MHIPKLDAYGQPFTDDGRQIAVERAAEVVKEKRLADAAMLYLVSHRPLSFAASQLLYALQPLASLLDIPCLTDYAEMLQDPDRFALLLTNAAEDASTQVRTMPAELDQVAARSPVKGAMKFDAD